MFIIYKVQKYIPMKLLIQINGGKLQILEREYNMPGMKKSIEKFSITFHIQYKTTIIQKI